MSAIKAAGKKRQAPASTNGAIWAVEDIVDGPKVEMVGTKKRKLYKVRWSETYELESNIPPELIELYEQREKKQIKILGPLVTSDTTPASSPMDEPNKSPNPNSTSNGGTNAHIPLQQTKFAVEIGDQVKCMSYKEVRNMYKEELLQYFEERAKIDEE